MAEPVKGGRAYAPQILADQLALSQLWGQIMPTTLLLAPPDFQTFRHPCQSSSHICSEGYIVTAHIVFLPEKNDVLQALFRLDCFICSFSKTTLIVQNRHKKYLGRYLTFSQHLFQFYWMCFFSNPLYHC